MKSFTKGEARSDFTVKILTQSHKGSAEAPQTSNFEPNTEKFCFIRKSNFTGSAVSTLTVTTG